VSELIKQLIALLGPLLGALIKKWLEDLLNRAAKKVDVSDLEEENSKMTTVLEKAIAMTPRVRAGRRMLLKNILWVVEDRDFPPRLSEVDKDDIKDAVTCAKKDEE